MTNTNQSGPDYSGQQQSGVELSSDSGSETAFLFDLDGTLVDSVYQHVLAWREALEEGGIRLAVWRIHRQIGMSGGLFVNALLRETGLSVSAEEVDRLAEFHSLETPKP